jgi:hypothetical protein
MRWQPNAADLINYKYAPVQSVIEIFDFARYSTNLSLPLPGSFPSCCCHAVCGHVVGRWLQASSPCVRIQSITRDCIKMSAINGCDATSTAAAHAYGSAVGWVACASCVLHRLPCLVACASCVMHRPPTSTHCAKYLTAAIVGIPDAAPPPYASLSTPVYSLVSSSHPIDLMQTGTQAEPAEDARFTMNIITYASPIALRPQRKFALGLYTASLSYEFVRSSGRAVLQVSSTYGQGSICVARTRASHSENGGPGRRGRFHSDLCYGWAYAHSRAFAPCLSAPRASTPPPVPWTDAPW